MVASNTGMRAGDEPIPDGAWQHAVRRFAVLIPLSAHDEATPAFQTAWQVLASLHTPFLCVFGAEDHVTGGDHSALSDRIPGAAEQPHLTIPDAAHFIHRTR